MKRPFAATLMAVIAAFAGIVAIFDTLRYLRLLPAASFGSLDFYGGSIFGAILSGMVALIWFWAAARVWNLDPRGWSFIVTIAAIYLIFDLVALLFGNPFYTLGSSFWITLLALVLGLLPGTKTAFGQP
jgi:uncharacterized membrane protein